MLEKVVRSNVTIYDETLSGAVNSVNVIFTTAFAFESNSLILYLNGLKLKIGINNDYVILNNQTVQMEYPLIPGDRLTASYNRKL